MRLPGQKSSSRDTGELLSLIGLRKIRLSHMFVPEKRLRVVREGHLAGLEDVTAARHQRRSWRAPAKGSPKRPLTAQTGECRRWDLNPHSPEGNRILSPARLPIPPSTSARPTIVTPVAAFFTIAVMRVGMLTGGGDCPGLNAVIRAVSSALFFRRGTRWIGVLEGWKGPRREASSSRRGHARSPGSSRGAARSCARRGRTRTRSRAAWSVSSANFERERLDALVAIGGEDTLGVAARLLRGARLPRSRRPEDDRQRPLV